MNKKDMWVPLKKKTNKHKTQDGQRMRRQREIQEERFDFFFLSLFSQIHGNLTFGFRRDKHEKCYTRRGLHVGTKNKGFHREFR